jgi:1-acyl-sn-glycerol-3-phosphate acyltransferase
MNQPAEQFVRPFAQRASYAVLRQLFRVVAFVCFGVRCYGRENLPETGGALYCANHQSNLDPPLVGLLSNRRMNYLAKKPLFQKQPLKFVIEHLDAIPIDRSGMGLGGIKETIRRLRREEQVLIFPEGKRTFDGEMQALMPGFVALARRTNVPMVPIGMDGAFDAWRRGTMFPKFRRIYLVVGKPFTPAEYENMNDEQMVVELESRIRACFEAARSHRLRSLSE